MALTNEEILDAIAAMTVQQAADLVKAMEEKFGVTAAVAVYINNDFKVLSAATNFS